MTRYLPILFSLLLASPATAQDAETGIADAEQEQAAEEEQAVEPEAEPEAASEEETVDFDETGLDEQGFVDEDDDFDPTEQIPTDQSIEFPADI
ncbi:MAG: hypothetical protein QNJ23_02780 [Woeseiaceae bacterium]|nr:hypothetical protein [Woeseiaceae bacterium]